MNSKLSIVGTGMLKGESSLITTLEISWALVGAEIIVQTSQRVYSNRSKLLLPGCFLAFVVDRVKGEK